MASAGGGALPLKKRKLTSPQAAAAPCDSSPAVVSAAGNSSQSDAARAAPSTDGAPSDSPVNQPRVSTMLNDDATTVGDAEATLGSGVSNEDLPRSGSSRGRHAEDPAPGPASPTAPAAVLSEDELKERLLQLCTGSGERPAATSGLRSMAGVTVALILNVMAAVTALMGSHQKPGPHREEIVRCCGELDNEEARGYLVNDAVGRPLLYRDDDREENHARDVGKRVWNAAAKAQREMAAQKERDAAAVLAAKRAAAKDPTKEAAVAEMQRWRAIQRTPMHSPRLLSSTCPP